MDERPASAEVTFRTAEQMDLPELLRLARAFYDEDGFSTSDQELSANFLVLLDASNAHVTVASDRTGLCGFALTTTAFILESGLVAELQDLYVDPTIRRTGIGRRLIDEAAEWARSCSASLLVVVVAPNGRDSSHLLKYYGKQGFRDDGRRILSREP